jgi:hypothetical protein
MHTSPQMKQTNQDSGSLAGSLAADGHQGRNRNQTDGELQQTSKKPREREGAGVDLELKCRNARGDEGNQQIGKGIRELGEMGKKGYGRTPHSTSRGTLKACSQRRGRRGAAEEETSERVSPAPPQDDSANGGNPRSASKRGLV